MMFKPKTALGIDISGNTIYLALLKQGKEHIELLKTASGHVPDGAIANGNIEDVAILARAIKKLKTANRITAAQTAISLVASPVLMQILDLPAHPPANIREFVRDKLKDYAILPIQKIMMDFCGLKSPGRSPNRRVFVVAANSRQINDLNRALQRLNVDIDAIEPAATAYFRACCAKKIAKDGDSNQLFAIIHEGNFTLSLFRNRTLDFVRTKHLESDTQSEEYFKWLAEEIRAIIQYYELEVADNCGKWKLTLVSDVSGRSFDDRIESLRAGIESVEIEVRTQADAYLDMPIPDAEHAEKPSAVAVGLAMKLLDAAADTPDINLLPEKTVKARTAHKQTLGIVNAAAVILLLMILSINFFHTKEKKIDENLIRQEQIRLSRNSLLLLNEQESLSRRISGISKKLDNMKNLLSKTSLFKWGRILSDIGRAVPPDVQITSTSCRDNLNLLIDGWARSYETVYDFVGKLNNSEHIDSASLIGTANRTRTDGLMRYSVNCLLVQEKGFQ